MKKRLYREDYMYTTEGQQLQEWIQEVLDNGTKVE